MPFPGSISDSISLCCVQVYHGLAVHHFDQFGRSEPVFQFESVHKYRFFLQKKYLSVFLECSRSLLLV